MSEVENGNFMPIVSIEYLCANGAIKECVQGTFYEMPINAYAAKIHVVGFDGNPEKEK